MLVLRQVFTHEVAQLIPNIRYMFVRMCTATTCRADIRRLSTHAHAPTPIEGLEHGSWRLRVREVRNLHVTKLANTGMFSPCLSALQSSQHKMREIYFDILTWKTTCNSVLALSSNQVWLVLFIIIPANSPPFVHCCASLPASKFTFSPFFWIGLIFRFPIECMGLLVIGWCVHCLQTISRMDPMMIISWHSCDESLLCNEIQYH